MSQEYSREAFERDQCGQTGEGLARRTKQLPDPGSPKELAMFAKAAGFTFLKTDFHIHIGMNDWPFYRFLRGCLQVQRVEDGPWIGWNPRNSLTDAFELADKLDFRVAQRLTDSGEWNVWARTNYPNGWRVLTEDANILDAICDAVRESD